MGVVIDEGVKIGEGKKERVRERESGGWKGIIPVLWVLEWELKRHS